MATTFAGKEAVFKALQDQNVQLNDIEIIRNKNGKPYAIVGKKKVNLSLSFDGDYAIGFAVIS